MTNPERLVYIGQARVGRHLGVGTPAVINWRSRFPGHCAEHDKCTTGCEACDRASAKAIPPPDAFMEMDTKNGPKDIPLWLPERLQDWDDWMSEKRWRLPG